MLSVQLYSVRDVIAKQGYEKTIRELAAMGYDGMEPAGYPGTTVQEAAKLFKELSLASISTHTSLPLGDDKQRILEEADCLGAKYMITGGAGPDAFETLDNIKATAERYNEAALVAREFGFKIGLHNHWQEMAIFDGKPGYRWFLDLTEPEVVFEVDTYWVKVGGLDPMETIKDMAERAPLIHLKDGSGVKEDPMLAVGSGIMPVAEIIKAATYAENFVVELDRCATDMMVAMSDSIKFVKPLMA
ncbi:MAG: sugar phosphate isomerase/epimerase [Kiritimatiellae bacterium]|jgi:sugar phosphate isomerase/epimerase|nr:sugar phosphate isomerase/epimerase [Kiritimatiellia bacterium]